MKWKTGVPALEIDIARIEADLAAVNAIGTREGRPGINRVSLSDADMAGRRWLMERMRDAGLEPRMDGVGNVFGRWEAGEGAAVLAGSHLDTVPDGGPLDGALGTIAALEAVRAMREAAIAPRRPVEVVCTADEEGRFGGMLGSQAIVGEVGADWIAAAADDRGLALPDALAAQGLGVTGPLARDPAGIAVFLELHIEQGPVLERSGDAVGIVEAISGVFNWTVTLTGEANHSGTTPMELRRDAFRGLADFAAGIDGILARAGGAESRITVGQVALAPNFAHSIAGEAVFSVIGRDGDAAVMRAMADACRAEIGAAASRHGLQVAIEERSWLPPTALDPGVATRLCDLAATRELAARRMTSGAGHDAQTFARHVPAGLLFVPSIGGISHAPRERTARRHIEAGALLLATAVAAFALDG